MCQENGKKKSDRRRAALWFTFYNPWAWQSLCVCFFHIHRIIRMHARTPSRHTTSHIIVHINESHSHIYVSILCICMRAEFSTHTFTFDIRADHYMDSDILSNHLIALCWFIILSNNWQRIAEVSGKITMEIITYSYWKKCVRSVQLCL
jgi:hypothetical protein